MWELQQGVRGKLSQLQGTLKARPIPSDFILQALRLRRASRYGSTTSRCMFPEEPSCSQCLGRLQGTWQWQDKVREGTGVQMMEERGGGAEEWGHIPPVGSRWHVGLGRQWWGLKARGRGRVSHHIQPPPIQFNFHSVSVI